ASPAPTRSRRVTKIGITFCTWLFSPIFCSNFHFEVGGTNVFSASSAARRKCFSTAWFMSCDSLLASASVSILNQVPFGPSHTNCIRPPLGKASRGLTKPPSCVNANASTGIQAEHFAPRAPTQQHLGHYPLLDAYARHLHELRPQCDFC